MDIDQEMEKWCGPKAIVLPEEGKRYRLPTPGVTATIKLAPDFAPHFKYSLVRYDFERNAAVELDAYTATGRIFFCLRGRGTVILNGEAKPLEEGTFIHVGEGHHIAINNDGNDELQVFTASFPPGPEAREDLLVETANDLPILNISPDMRRAFGTLDRAEAAGLNDGRKGELYYVEPEEGLSYWQAKPTAGYIQVKMAPFTHNVHHYSAATQRIYPGNRVREHAHNQLNELFVISKGLVTASLDGEEAVIPTGSVVIIGRNVFHWWGNAGDTDAQNFAIVDPPGVEGALAFTGRLRSAGETWPDDIVRNAETGKILHDRFGFVIAAGAADAVR